MATNKNDTSSDTSSKDGFNQNDGTPTTERNVSHQHENVYSKSLAHSVISNEEIAQIIKRREKQFLDNEIRIVLIGKTGVGKSATGNTILGMKAFKADDGMSSVTQRCDVKETTIGRRRVLVTDTPGIFDTERDAKDLENEILDCIRLTSPGPHAILYVIKLNEKFKSEDYDAFITFVKYFGVKMLDHVVAVFTHADILVKKELTLGKYLETSAPKTLHTILEHLGNRMIAFDNGSPELPNQQVDNLFSIIETIRRGMNTPYYRDDIYDSVEKHIIETEKEERKAKKGMFYQAVKEVIGKKKEEAVLQLELRIDNEFYRLRQGIRKSARISNFSRTESTIQLRRDELEKQFSTPK